MAVQVLCGMLKNLPWGFAGASCSRGLGRLVGMTGFGFDLPLRGGCAKSQLLQQPRSSVMPFLLYSCGTHRWKVLALWA